MKQSLTPEERAELALNSLDGIQHADVPDALEEKVFSRFRSMTARTPKWFWAAAVVLLLVNVVAAWNYLGTSKAESSGINAVAGYYFTGGNSWYE